MDPRMAEQNREIEEKEEMMRNNIRRLVENTYDLDDLKSESEKKEEMKSMVENFHKGKKLLKLDTKKRNLDILSIVTLGFALPYTLYRKHEINKKINKIQNPEGNQTASKKFK